MELVQPEWKSLEQDSTSRVRGSNELCMRFFDAIKTRVVAVTYDDFFEHLWRDMILSVQIPV